MAEDRKTIDDLPAQVSPLSTDLIHLRRGTFDYKMTRENFLQASPSTSVLVDWKTFSTGNFLSTTNVMTHTNNFVQNTEGIQVMALPYTPHGASNWIFIDTVVHGGSTAISDSWVTAALFEDDDLFSIGVSSAYLEDTPGGGENLKFSVSIVPSVLTTITFKVRAGHRNAGTFNFNGNGGTGKYNGTYASSITVYEYLPPQT